MKAQIDAGSPLGKNNFGRVRKNSGKVRKARKNQEIRQSDPNSNSGHSRVENEEENEEIKAYLTKLQDLVPFIPKNKKLSKLEVITNAIGYIRDLRETLGFSPCSDDEDDDNHMDFLDVDDTHDHDHTSPLISRLSAEDHLTSVLPSSHLLQQSSRQPLSVIPDANGNLISSSSSASLCDHITSSSQEAVYKNNKSALILDQRST